MISLATGGGTISEESTDAATELCTDIAEEGIVLLKNDDSTLPLASGDNVNVFGWASINPCYGGTGSGALSDAFPMVSLLDGLRGAGLNPNQELIDFYTNYKADRPEVGMWAGDWTLPEPAASLYTDELMNSAKEYSDSGHHRDHPRRRRRRRPAHRHGRSGRRHRRGRGLRPGV